MPARSVHIRLSDGLIQYEYDESRPDPVPDGDDYVRRASHIDPVAGSSPPRFVINWEPWLHDLMGKQTWYDDNNRSFRSYGEAVAYERKLLRERYFSG